MSTPAPDPAAVLASCPIDDVSITPHLGGHINRSWRVEARTGVFLLQRINPVVFPDGAAVMRNMQRVTGHLEAALTARGGPDLARRALRLVPASGGSPAVRVPDGAWWRLLHFIAGTITLERVTQPDQAFQAGRAFAEFLALLSDVDGGELTETIPGFRDTSGRLAQLDRAVAADRIGRVGTVRQELAALDARREYARLFPPLIASGALPRRVVHNDAKSGNVLRDAVTGEALAVVDLDTVMPGTALSDVGDLIRSMASPTDEDEQDLALVAVQPALVEGLARGYLSAAGAVLAPEERRHFIAAGLVTTYEQAVRFFADYLDGDRYYHTSRLEQNLDRGRAQLKLLQSLEGQRRDLEGIVSAL